MTQRSVNAVGTVTRGREHVDISSTNAPIRGYWEPDGTELRTGSDAIRSALFRLHEPVFMVRAETGIGVGEGGRAVLGNGVDVPADGYPLLAHAPALPAENLGDPGFRRRHGLRFAYIAGAMANGITSVRMVTAMARAGMIGFFGAAGLSPDAVEAAVVDLKSGLGDRPFGVNLIHSPNDPALESAVVDRYLKHEIRTVSASAYLDLTPMLIRYRLHGIRRQPDGRVVCPNQVVAKVSRVEVARRFLSPPPEKFVAELRRTGAVTAEEAALAGEVPVASDLTAEADSGGHTDNRPALALLPTLMALRDQLCDQYGYVERPAVGLAGGIATPAATAAAFAMGAAFVLTGSINQACVEAGTSAAVREMLAEAGQADVTMAPAADMFEMGVRVQVLKRGTMFPQRAARLHDLYRTYSAFSEIPESDRRTVERDFLKKSFEDAWAETRAFFQRRDPRQVERADRDPRHRMALVFRSYLGLSSRWAVEGVADRRIDYQIWCGPAIGAFNEWVRGSFLAPAESRDVVTVARNLLAGAAVATRAASIRNQGLSIPAEAERFHPLPGPELERMMRTDV